MSLVKLDAPREAKAGCRSDVMLLYAIAPIVTCVCVCLHVTEKLLNSEGRELRRALFSLKQIFQVSFYV